MDNPELRQAASPIGIYHRSLPDVEQLTPREALVRSRELGLSGCLFASPLALSPTLDRAEPRDERAVAAELGQALGVGVGRINPYHFDAETEVRTLGEGDFGGGLEKLVRAGHEIGCSELWFSIGTLADRFDRSVPWSAQLAAAEAFLRSLLAEVTRLSALSERKRARGEISKAAAYQTDPSRRLQPTLDYLRGVLK